MAVAGKVKASRPRVFVGGKQVIEGCKLAGRWLKRNPPHVNLMIGKDEVMWRK